VLSALAPSVKDVGPAMLCRNDTAPAIAALSNDTQPECDFLDANQFCLCDLRVCVVWATSLVADLGQSHRGRGIDQILPHPCDPAP
jgi:hypothetical protein